MELRLEPLSDARWAEIIDDLTGFIAHGVREQNRVGGLLGVSGGIDSALTAALAVRALGPDKVHACFLPDADSDESSMADAQEVVEWLGITNVHKKDITPLLKAMGTYDLFPDLYALPKEEQARWVAARKNALVKAGTPGEESAFLQGYRQKASPEMSRVRAFWNSKIRCRMVVAYAEAELRNLAVLGTTNRSEYLTGFFTKYGDGAVDLEVILPLYKTRVFELASRLGVPESVVKKTPSADIVPGIVDEDILGISYAQLDRILLRLERGLGAEEVASAAGADLNAVRRVSGLIESSRFTRTGAAAPEVTVD